MVLAAGDGADDGLAGWIEAYFRVEVTTSEASQKVQRRDLERFLAFMLLEEGRDDRILWTGRLSGAFVQALRRELTADRPAPLRRSHHRPRRGAPEDVQ